MLAPNQLGCVDRNLLACVILAFCLDPVLLATAEEVSPAPAAPPSAPASPGVGGKCATCLSSLGSMFSGCKQHCCDSPLGTLINGIIKPIEFATGGVIPAPCPGPSDPTHKSGGGGGDSAGGGKGPPGPRKAAEAIKQDQAQAKARIEAVQYLATVPCHYYPEAEVALITALRTDRSECVRWEAAHALAQGCCCTKKTIEALKIAAEGSQQDGNPRELSMRVRVEAINAIQHCLAMYGGTLGAPQRPESPAGKPEQIPTPPVPTRPESPQAEARGGSETTQARGDVRFASYYEEAEKRPARELLAEARHLVEMTGPIPEEKYEPRGGKSLFALWQRAREPAKSHNPPAESEAAMLGGPRRSAAEAAPSTAMPSTTGGHHPGPELARLPPVSVLHSPRALVETAAPGASNDHHTGPHPQLGLDPNATGGTRFEANSPTRTASRRATPVTASSPNRHGSDSPGQQRRQTPGDHPGGGIGPPPRSAESARQRKAPTVGERGPSIRWPQPAPLSKKDSAPLNERGYAPLLQPTQAAPRPEWLTEQILAHDGGSWR